MRRRIQITALVAACCLPLADLNAQVNSDSLIAIYTKKMNTYLDKENKAPDVFSFTKEGMEVYAPATDTSGRKLEFAIQWNKIEWYKNIFEKYEYPGIMKMIHDSVTGSEIAMPVSIKQNLSKPLAHFKIALDPGHIAGDLETAKKEKKWVEMKSPAIELIEGELTLSTALILRKKLEARGATVMLTRNKPGISSFGIDFKKWKDSLFVNAAALAYQRGDMSFEEKHYLIAKASDIEIFRRFFLVEDVRERARKINEFHPDVTLAIHYNVDETNVNWNKPTRKNYNMAFVGGSFTDDELDTPEARMEFLRLLLTEDMERSIGFSKYIVESLVQQTGVPAAMDSNAVYLKENCMPTGVSGVYCRNLTLTRKVKGVVCYGESLYQDNIKECKALSKKEVKIDGMETSRRVEEVADAYYQGIMNYIINKKK